MKLGMEVSLGADHIVLDGDPAPLPQNGGTAAYVCCDQTAGRIKMPLGTELGLSPDHTMLDGDPAPPSFWPMSIVAKWCFF